MSDDKKPWERPWYPKEIAENASNWSFAADLSLLKYLEVFSEDLLSRATVIDENVNSLLNNLENASSSLDIAKNQFLSLSNTQFIESRVYEDDETLSAEEKIENEEPNQNNTDDINKNEMKLAALRGIEVIEKYFKKVEVVDSDSEEGADFKNFVLHPKDPYIDRPLPYVIGTEKWYKKLHVGLEESSSESEDEKISEKYSDTDSESDLPITNRSQAKSISETDSSEVDLSNKLDYPVANSTFNDTNKLDEHPESNEDYNSISAQPTLAQSSFAEQLAAKLGNVVNNNQDPEINTRPIRKSSNYDIYKGFFSDEPPPLDDLEDEFSPRSKDQGIFSGGDGLFDDFNDEEPFWGSGTAEKQEKVAKPEEKKTSSSFFESNEEDDIFSNTKKNDSKTSDNRFKKDLNAKLNKLKEQNLFSDEMDNDEDSLFGKASIVDRNSKKQDNLFENDSTSLQNKETNKFFDEDSLFKSAENIANKKRSDEDSTSNVEPTKRKTPVGGIQVISNPNLFSGQNVKKILKSRSKSSSSESTDLETTTDEVDKIQSAAKDVTKIEENVKINPSQKETSKKFFDDDEDDLFKADLFSTKKISSDFFGEPGGLFDDLEESDSESKKNEDSMGILGSEAEKLNSSEAPSKMVKSKKTIEEPFSNLKRDVQNLFSGEDSDSDDLFSSKQSKNRAIEDQTIKKSLKPKRTDPKTKKIPSLFDDDDENNDDDLFSSNFFQNKKSSVISGKATLDLFNDEENNKDSLFSTNEESEDNKDNPLQSNSLSQAKSLNDEDISVVDKSSLINHGDIFGDSIEEDIFKSEKEIKVSKQIDNLFEDDSYSDLFGSKTREMVKENKLREQEHKINSSFEDIKELSVEIHGNVEEIGDAATQNSKIVGTGRIAPSIQEEVVDVSSKEIEEIGAANKIPTVSIFDPDPPPDLDDWVTGSNPNIFDEDMYTFEGSDNFEENRSSIFDREPPSVFSESSGIVRDQSARIDTDVSSFYPYASSSRRLSTDLFNEEQSNDSLLTGRMRHSFEPNIPPPISEIVEDSLSNLEITPSGNPEDLYTECSDHRKQTKSVTFEGDFKVTKGENDSNGGVNGKPSVSKKPELKDNVRVEEEIEDSKDHEGEMKNTAEVEKKDEGSPGKLKHNLNINVFALLPGAGKPPKKETQPDTNETRHNLQPAQRSMSLDFDQPATDDFTRGNDVKISTGTSQGDSDGVEVLQSVTKSRARGPVKRRPSTKKGRQAFRNSCVDFTFVSNPTSEDLENDDKEVVPEPSDAHISSVEDSVQTAHVSPNKRLIPVENSQQTTEIVETSDVLNISHPNDTPEIEIPVQSPTQIPEESKISSATPENEKPDTGASQSTSKPKIASTVEDSNTVAQTSKTTPPITKSITNPRRPAPVQRRFAETSISRLQRIYQPEPPNPLDATETSGKSDRMNFFNELLINQQEKPDNDPIKATETSTNRFKRMGFLNDLISSEDNSSKRDVKPATTTRKPAGVVETSKLLRKWDLFGDDMEDDELFSTRKGKKPEKTSNFLSVESDIASSDVTRRSSFVKTDNFASPEFTKANLSEDEAEDVFSEKKLPPKSNILKRSPYDDDDEEDMLGQSSKSKSQVTNISSISARRLKTSSLKKLENTIVTGDDPLSALEK